MDADFPGAVEHARDLVLKWVADNVPAEWLEDRPRGADLAERSGQWRSLLDSGGWIGASWPVQYGGMGLSPIEATAIWDELYQLPLPTLHESLGEVLVGPTLLAWGTEAQKQRYLPGIIDGTELWCQGFSEPGSGSDLASVQTRAVPGDHGWGLTGSKIWTSGADRADHMFLLARTDPEQSRHRGLSFFLMPMRQPGVDVRPIERLDGTAGFCEVFLDDAHCPADGLVGAVNDGWRVATTTLAHERGTSSTTNYWRFRREVAAVIAEYQQAEAAGPELRLALARAWGQVEVLRANHLRTLAGAGHGGSPSDAFLTAANKLIWSEYHQHLTELRMRILGLGGLVMEPAGDRGTDGKEGVLSPAQVDYLFARSETIWGGTSEIQRNIVGERALGLPR